jgi:diaminopimelate decarboxylase
LSSPTEGSGEGEGRLAGGGDAAARRSPRGFPDVAGALARAGKAHGTPVYVTDLLVLDDAAKAVRNAFPDPWLRHYSVKANDVPAIVGEVARRGFGANVVSRGEWAVARRAGVANGRITLEGIGKTDADLRAAVRAAADGSPLLWVALESADEADVITALARRSGLGRGDRPPLDVLVRLNPEVTPETISGLAVGAAASKFGMTETEATGLVEWITSHAAGSIRPRGVHLHVGSQLGAVDAWRDAVRRGLAVVGLLRGGLPAFDTLDVGGGFPVMPLDETGPTPERFARELPGLLDAVPVDRRPSRLAIEPGRALVARAGWLVSRVLHVRDRGGRQVVIDAGMTELIRPALYGARHPIVALTREGRAVGDEPLALEPTRVEGPICESTDALGMHDLPPLRRGDIVAIADAGAYAASLSSTYNGRPRAAQVFLDADGQLTLVRRARP